MFSLTRNLILLRESRTDDVELEIDLNQAINLNQCATCKGLIKQPIMRCDNQKCAVRVCKGCVSASLVQKMDGSAVQASAEAAQCCGHCQSGILRERSQNSRGSVLLRLLYAQLQFRCPSGNEQQSPVTPGGSAQVQCGEALYSYPQLEEHVRTCEYLRVKCHHSQLCKERPLRRDVAEHTLICPYALVTCQWCEKAFERRQMHSDACKDEQTACSMCATQLTRQQLQLHKREGTRECLRLQIKRVKSALCQAQETSENATAKIKEHEVYVVGKFKKLIKKLSSQISSCEERNIQLKVRLNVLENWQKQQNYQPNKKQNVQWHTNNNNDNLSMSGAPLNNTSSATRQRIQTLPPQEVQNQSQTQNLSVDSYNHQAMIEQIMMRHQAYAKLKAAYISKANEVCKLPNFWSNNNWHIFRDMTNGHDPWGMHNPHNQCMKCQELQKQYRQESQKMREDLSNDVLVAQQAGVDMLADWCIINEE